MKRLTTILVAMLLVVSLCACDQKAPTWQEQYDLGVRYLSEGNYEEAIIAFTAAIEIDPKQVEAYVGRGDAYTGFAGQVSSGETTDYYNNAIADYLESISLNGTDSQIYLKIAKIYITLGEKGNARNILKKGYEITNDENLLAWIDMVSLATTEKRNATIDGVVGYTINIYNDEGWLVQQEWYYSDDTLHMVCTFEYNDAGMLMQCKKEYAHHKENGFDVRSELYNTDGKRIKDAYYSNDGDIWENEYSYVPGSTIVDIHIYNNKTEYAPVDADITYEMESANNYVRIGGFSADANGTLLSYNITEYEPLVPGKATSDQIRHTEFKADGSPK